jgi:hypothetical protein
MTRSRSRTNRTPALLCAALAVAACGSALVAEAPPRAMQGQTPSRTAGLVSPCPGCGYAPEPVDVTDRTGWRQIFDGTTLTGWDGNPEVWKVEDGVITATSTAQRRVGSTYLIWRGGEPADFELKLDIKADADIHSGVFYRGRVGPNAGRQGGGAARAAGTGSAAPGARAGAAPARPAQTLAVPADPKWNVTGYSLDFDYPMDNVGNLQDTTGRGEVQIAWRGYVVRMEAGKRPRAIGVLGDRAALLSAVRQGDWNTLHIIAKANHLTHIVNGQVMAMLIDDDAEGAKAKGVIALQIEQFGAGTINFRNIWLKE